MLFDTVAEYDAEIADTRAALKKAMTDQAFATDGPARGHYQRGNVGEIRGYLKMLSEEREMLLRRAGGEVGHAEFRRAH